MDIGTRIAYLRRQANMTQAKLADTLHVSPKTVSKWENGYGLPDIKIVPELAAVLGVDADFLLTGRGKPLRRVRENGKTGECIAVQSTESLPTGKNMYSLRLHQVTHSNLTVGLLLLNILMLVLAVIGSPVSELSAEGFFMPYSLLAFIYPGITGGSSVLSVQGGDMQGWAIAIGVIWIIFFFVFVALCIRGILASLDGRNDYFKKCAWIQFGGCALLFSFSFVACVVVNIYKGEVCLRPNGVFAALIMCALVHLLLTLLYDKHRKLIGHWKGGSVLSCIAALALSITFCVLPNTLVPTVFAADSVQFSEWNIQLRQDYYVIEGTDFVYFDGYSALVVRSNVKTEYMYLKKATYRCTYADGSSEIRTLPVETEYIKTEYKGRAYYNFFTVNVRIDAPPTASFSDFEYSCSFSEDSARTIFTVKSNSVEILPPESEISEFWNRGDSVYSNGGSLDSDKEFDLFYGLSVCEQTQIFGYQTNLSDLEISYILGEYNSLDCGRQLYEFVGFNSDYMIMQEKAKINVAVFKVKDAEGGYKAERRIYLNLHINVVSPLRPYMYVRILTDRGTIPIIHKWNEDFIAGRYMQNL